MPMNSPVASLLTVSDLPLSLQAACSLSECTTVSNAFSVAFLQGGMEFRLKTFVVDIMRDSQIW